MASSRSASPTGLSSGVLAFMPTRAERERAQEKRAAAVKRRKKDEKSNDKRTASNKKSKRSSTAERTRSLEAQGPRTNQHPLSYLGLDGRMHTTSVPARAGASVPHSKRYARHRVRYGKTPLKALQAVERESDLQERRVTANSSLSRDAGLALQDLGRWMQLNVAVHGDESTTYTRRLCHERTDLTPKRARAALEELEAKGCIERVGLSGPAIVWRFGLGVEFDHGVTASAPRWCEQCDAEFAPSRSDARFCSSACKQAAYRERRKKITAEEVAIEEHDEKPAKFDGYKYDKESNERWLKGIKKFYGLEPPFKAKERSLTDEERRALLEKQLVELEARDGRPGPDPPLAA
jgi:hypothetical protein